MTVNAQRVKSGNIGLHVETFGHVENVPVVLVHGYPDNHLVWKPVAERLAKQYYVIAYDVRGAGQSDVPERESEYRLSLLAADLAAIVDVMIPRRQFHLVGHDWGSVQSWESVATDRLRGRIASFTSISGPCLDHIGYWIRNKSSDRSLAGRTKLFKQALRSWYIGFFHIPLLAQAAWRAGLDKLWPRYMKHREGVAESAPNPTLAKDGEDGVYLYRANFRDRFVNPQERYAHCPVQLIVPTRDHYVGPESFDGLEQWVDDLYRRDIDACHWVILSHPDVIADWIDEFAKGVESGRMPGSLARARVSAGRPSAPSLYAVR